MNPQDFLSNSKWIKYKEHVIQFESRILRSFWISLLLGSIPDIVIAIVIAKLTKGGILIFFLIIIILQLIYFLIWIKNSSWGWIIFFIGGRKKLSILAFDFLVENNFPEPENYQTSAASYLEMVANNEDMSMDIRLKAAVELGGLFVYRNQWKIQQYLRICMAYEDAIEQYKRLFINNKRQESN